MKKLIPLLFSLAAFSCAEPAYSQRQEQQGPKCQPRHTLSVETIEEHLMFEDDGDRWVLLTNRGTGDQLIGFIELKSQHFCTVGIGTKKVRPRT